jgi:hypothetical protein
MRMAVIKRFKKLLDEFDWDLKPSLDRHTRNWLGDSVAFGTHVRSAAAAGVPRVDTR